MSKKIECTESEKLHIIGLYESGKTVRQVGIATGFSSHVIVGLLDRWDVRPRRHVTNRSKIANSIVSEIVKRYQNGEGMEALSKTYGMNWKTIRKVLESHGQTIRSIKDVDFTEKETIISMYLKGLSSPEIGKRLGLSGRTVASRLRYWGIELRSRHDESYYKYDLDHSFFDEIDTEEKAYFLGLLYADGYNSDGYNQSYFVSLSLQKRDVAILEKFRSAIKSSAPIFDDSRKGQYIFKFNSKSISKQLTKLGCHRAKSFTLIFPDWLSEDMLPHFIRGYIDGDGWVTLHGRHFAVGAIGSDAFIKSLGKITAEKCQVNPYFKPHKVTKGILNVLFQGRDQASKVLAWLYKDATVYLERKHQQALKILTPIVYTPHRKGESVYTAKLSSVDITEIMKKIEQGKRRSSIAKEYKVTISAIDAICQGRAWTHITGWDSENNKATGTPKGEACPSATTTADQVLEIKRLILENVATAGDISSLVGVSKSVVQKIRSGKAWGHLTGF